MTHKFVIHFDRAGNGTTVELDGKTIKNLRAVGVRTSVDHATTVTLEFTAVEVEAHGETDLIDITNLDAYARTYKKT